MERRTPAALQRLLAEAQRSAIGLEIEPDDSGVGIRLRNPSLYFHHSFIGGPLVRRASQPKQALLRACNNKARSIERVLDLTAGWGADSLVLASHGQCVTLLERNALIFGVLACSLELLAVDSAGAKVARRMTLENAEAGTYLRGLDDARTFDCIYLDPMFPVHKSGAKPAKDMQILQALADNHAIEPCFDLALRKARRRVVVKRPARAATLNSRKPDIVYREKTIRFDVYLTA